MTLMRSACALFLLLITFAFTALAVEQRPGRVTFKIVDHDTGPKETIGTDDRLYLRINYESTVPVRFLIEAFRQDLLQQDAFASSTPPYDAGKGEAIAWIGFHQPIRIDELRVTAYDLDWRELGIQFADMVVTWETRENEPPRQPAPWIDPLLKHHRHVFDNTFDPQPKKPAPLFDLLFLLSLIAMPVYLIMQFQMLLRYRGQWQWYAFVPLLPIIPLGLYSALGLGLSTALWIIFLFRYMAVSLLYLLILWAVKWRHDRDSALADPRDSSEEDSA